MRPDLLAFAVLACLLQGKTTAQVCSQRIANPAGALSDFEVLDIGERHAIFSNPDLGSGEVYVFERTSPSSPLTMTATVQSPQPGQRFGIGASRIGNTMTVLEWISGAGRPALHVFSNTSGPWVPVALFDRPTLLGKDPELALQTQGYLFIVAKTPPLGSSSTLVFQEVPGGWQFVQEIQDIILFAREELCASYRNLYIFDAATSTWMLDFSTTNNAPLIRGLDGEGMAIQESDGSSVYEFRRRTPGGSWELTGSIAAPSTATYLHHFDFGTAIQNVGSGYFYLSDVAPPLFEEIGSGDLEMRGGRFGAYPMWEQPSGSNGYRSEYVVRDLSCLSNPSFPRPLGSTYCPQPAANSSGQVGDIDVLGTGWIVHTSIELVASSLPANTWGIFAMSRSPASIPFPGGSFGELCLGTGLGRFQGPGQILNSGSAGTFALAADLNALPNGPAFVPAIAGEELFFQAWHRDSINGVVGSGFTTGTRVTFR